MEGKLLSLDIWDTVLRRRCYPDESKFGLARYILLMHYDLLKIQYKNVLPYGIVRVRSECEYMLACENKIKGWDDEYAINEVLILWIDKIMVPLPVAKKIELVDEFVQVELNHEMYISYLDPEICKKIDGIDYDQLIYISDFYMTKSHMDTLLQRYNSQITFDGGLVSSDYYINKKSGRLFKQFQEVYGQKVEKHIHLGDNKISDVKSPRQMGIQSSRYLPFKETVLRMTHKVDYILRCKVRYGGKGKLSGYFSSVKKQLKYIRHDDPYVDLGVEHSIYYITFILAIIENAIKEKVDTVYYFTREGEFFKQVHDAIEKADYFGFSIPKAKILEVSRIATYAPSIQEISINGMMRLWSQFPNQSVAAFFKSLHIDIAGYMTYLIKYGLEDVDERLNTIYDQEAIITLFEDKCFIRQLENEIEQKRILLLKYLAQKGIQQECEKVFIVDIGWRGSIQDNIAMLFPNVEIVGFYMGLFRPYYQRIPNSRKLGFISSDKEGNHLWYLRHPYPLETYTNSKNGSVVGYVETNDGIVQANRYNNDEEDTIYEQYIEKYQKGILLTIPIYSKMIRTYSFLADELMPYALKSLRKFIIHPNKKLTKAYFDLVYNSIYGAGKMEAMSKKINTKSVLKLMISPNPIKNILDLIEDSHWPHGLFMNYHLSIVNWFYSRFAKGMYNHYSSIHPLKYSKRISVSLKSYNNMNVNVFYEREELVSDCNCLYIRGNVVIPERLIEDYEIILQIEDKNRKMFYDTNKLIKNQKHTKDEVCFEAKIPLFKGNVRSQPHIIILNSKKILYTTFEA